MESPEQPGGIVASARLETFADGVFAIAITLLVLEIRIPLAIYWAFPVRARGD